MDEKQFLDIYFRDSSRGISSEYQGVRDITVQKFKGLTGLIDYGCKFITKGPRKGLCKHEKRYHGKDVGDDLQFAKMCCCGGCKHFCGHLSWISYKNLPVYAANFNDITGFWTENGCSLPRELRSEVCLSKICSRGCELSLTETNLFSIINQGEKAIEAYAEMFGVWNNEVSVYEHLKIRLEKEKEGKCQK